MRLTALRPPLVQSRHPMFRASEDPSMGPARKTSCFSRPGPWMAPLRQADIYEVYDIPEKIPERPSRQSTPHELARRFREADKPW